MNTLPEILEHVVVGPTDILVIRIPDNVTPEQVHGLHKSIPDELSGRVLAVNGKFEVVRKDTP